MTAVHIVLGTLVIAVNLAAGAWGAWGWYRFTPARGFWTLLRTGQALLVLEALLGGILLAIGDKIPGSLHYVYGLVPIAVSFVAEQLRVGAAEAVLVMRDLPDAKAVGRLPEDEQQSVVLQIVRREMGVMALSALVVAALALRAALGSGNV